MNRNPSTFSIFKVWLAAAGVLCFANSIANAGSGAYGPERLGYYDTVWPSEHTDLWRSHAVPDAGLPADFDPDRLAASTVRLNVPAWGYTRKRNEIFVTGGSPVALNSFTLAIKNSEPVNPEDILASLEADLDNPSVPFLAEINPKTMRAKQRFLTEGSTVNYTGGLLMHQNGYIYAVAQSVLYKIHPSSLVIVDSVQLPLVGTTPAENFWTTYNGFQVIASGKLVMKGFHFLNAPVPGWLLLIDPDSLVIDVQQQTNIGSARLTIDHTPDGKVWLYHMNPTETLRYQITKCGFILDDAWSRAYRTGTSDSTEASSPVLFGDIGQIFFADNTAPDPSTPINVYSQSVDTASLPSQLTGVPAFSENLAGFNFFMVAGDPFLTQTAMYYDPINNLVAVYKLADDGTITRIWERDNYKASASPAISPDRDLLYIDDYRDGRDELVILRYSSGEELARVPLEATLPTIGTIFLGTKDDVYIISSETGTTNGLVTRVYESSHSSR